MTFYFKTKLSKTICLLLQGNKLIVDGGKERDLAVQIYNYLYEFIIIMYYSFFAQ